MTEDQKLKFAKLVNRKKDEAAVDVVWGMELILSALGWWEAVEELAKELDPDAGRV